MKNKFLFLFAACLLGLAFSTSGGPSLPVTKPPVADKSILTGPPVDSAATNGQWFLDYASGVENYRTYEFHDNLFGGLMGVNAITGYVSSITYLAGPGTPITAFSVQATVWNDNIPVGEYLAGTNSHGESLLYIEPLYTGTLYNVKLTASFAVTDVTNIPSLSPIGPYPPYMDQSPYIEATNEDQAAWYCWSPESLESPTGGYFVPTWDFGDIPPGQSSTRQLDFVVPATLFPVDSRYNVLVQSQAMQADILLNRSTSLKISTWMDTISLDMGIPYPEEPFRGSDVSVFHNIPEEEEEPELDFGDAPDTPYPTLLANNGARHIIVPGIQMGPAIDGEADGQPTASADGDDTNMVFGVDDEDGVSFAGSNYAGQTNTAVVGCSTSGWLYIWVDFDANGSWADFGEHQNLWATQGLNNVLITFPTNAATGNTYARFRFTTETNFSLNYTGQARDGEVEDYLITILEEEEPYLDFGDANDPTYPTLLASGGACHIVVTGVCMGALIDAEADGQPDGTATGDDKANLADEDGVILPPLVAGGNAMVQVIASVPGHLNAWIDFNADGDWADGGEQVFINQPLNPGPNMLSLPLPALAMTISPQSRWRFTTYAPAAPSYGGMETDGEVEDYEITIEVLDFGDAPDPTYPTLLVNDGARHRVPTAYWLGPAAPDSEPDGLPTTPADGDDLANLADEDGVTLGGPLVRGQMTAAIIAASTSGWLDAWMDFNADGDWADAGENISPAAPLGPGANPFGITVPSSAELGPTYARFRFSSAGGLSCTGAAANGEVEDYMFTIYQQSPDTNTFAVTSMVISASNVITIQWAGESNATYETQTLGDLLTTAAPPWTAWGPRITGGPYTLTVTNILETTRFYRVIAPYAQ